MTSRRAWFVLFAVMLISFLGTAGIALPYPVLAPYFLEGEPNALTSFFNLPPKLLLGIALGIYPLGILLGSSFVGALSDRYGRRRILLITLGGSALGYALTVVAVVIESYPLFLLARWATGVCEGNISIARALAAELHPHIDRTKAISMVFATIYAGWLVGPLTGGYLMVYGAEAPFLAGAVAVILGGVVVAFAIEGNDREAQVDDQPGLWQSMVRDNSVGLLAHKEIRPIFRYYFAYTVGMNMFYEFYPVWFVEKLGADSRVIAWGTVSLTAAMIVTSVVAASRVANRLGQRRTLVVTSLALGMLFFIQPLSNAFWIYPIFMLIGAGNALGNGVVPAHLSENYGHLGEGRVMGLQTTIFCFTNVIVSILGSAVALLSTNLALWLGAIAMSSAFLCLDRFGATASEPMTADGVQP
ncbi:MFS transporter [Sulfidibacter corallicola]|uniref:MFS transporter n=1 Tax=Sulfidibacter corallicola TaxID=2818388 RepID=A0A8A4TNB4_SULCO|nr:MFS transporter [Sulfidibacter corallicola]QTD51040.1 MFS transporter [Sulfidibacter corallicola]